jgi:hypothetical protein
MTTKELIIEKINKLAPEQQQQVWAFINALPPSQTSKSHNASNFERHFGALEQETSIDNASIDTDLAHEYVNTHEAE